MAPVGCLKILCTSDTRNVYSDAYRIKYCTFFLSLDIFILYLDINEELHNLYMEHEMDRACSTNGEKRNACRILVGKPEGKRPLGRQRRRWVENIKIDLREIGWDGMDWIDLAQDTDQWRALLNAVMNLRVP
jgi:hypothetical protein